MRCFGEGNPVYQRYHDLEWGRPVTDDKAMYERLCLEGFQCGISWAIVLRKRDALRKAFADFEPEKVARYTNRRIERLLTDARLIRNRAKITASVRNARATLKLWEEGKSLTDLVWSFAPTRRRAPKRWDEVPASTPESTALAKELRARGFRFVGPTTAYATMQAAGLVNDHLVRCAVRREVEAQRREARRNSSTNSRMRG
jgi:DNA-3-methyladenine glycosylase I